MGMKIRHHSPLAAAYTPVRLGELHAGARRGGLTSMSTDDSREKTGANIAPLKQAINLTGMGAAAGGIRGAMWGTLVGLVFLNLLIGR
jgi:hypothetical protein